MCLKPFVYITRKLPEDELSLLTQQYEVEMWSEEDTAVPRAVLFEKVEKAQALLTMLSDQVDEEVLQRGKKLKIVANMAVGYDNVNVQMAANQGVLVTNTPDVLTETTADLVFSLILMTSRRTIEASDLLRRGEWTNWSPFMLAGADVHHKTIGIFGMGEIGQAVAHRARGFHMKIIYHNRKSIPEEEERLCASFVSFSELLEQADFVVCLAPLTAETRGVFGEKEFKAMKKSAIFINAARGAIVKESELITALKNNDIAGAGLDVFEREPIGSEHPLVALSNVVLLPHIGSATEETRRGMMRLCVQNIHRVLDGEKPLNVVHP